MEIEEHNTRTLQSLYIKGKYISHGSFGQVCMGVSRLDPSKVVAIKEVDRRKFHPSHAEILSKTVERETQYNIQLRDTNCPFIVEFIDSFFDDNVVYYVFEYCETTLGDLMNHYLESQHFAKREYILVKILYEMLLTLKVLQDNRLIHRDIKPDNILICGGTSKLGDFGYCRQLDQNLTSGKGSLRTTAPQSHTSTFYNKCDIWSLGVTIHNCLYGVEPFQQKLRDIQDPCSFRQVIMSKQFQVDIKRQSKISDILQRMIVVEESQRSDVDSLLQSPIFRVSQFSTPSDWIRGWLVYSSYLTLGNKSLDTIVLAIIGVAFSQCRVYHQQHKHKGKPIYPFALMFSILQLLVKILTEANAISVQNRTFVSSISKFYDQNFVDSVIKGLKSTHKSMADGIEKLSKVLASSNDMTSKALGLCSLYSTEGPEEEAMNQIVKSKYPELVILPTLIKIMRKNQRLNWSLSNVMAIAYKQPLTPAKFYFGEKAEYHEQVSVF